MPASLLTTTVGGIHRQHPSCPPPHATMCPLCCRLRLRWSARHSRCTPPPPHTHTHHSAGDTHCQHSRCPPKLAASIASTLGCPPQLAASIVSTLAAHHSWQHLSPAPRCPPQLAASIVSTLAVHHRAPQCASSAADLGCCGVQDIRFAPPHPHPPTHIPFSCAPTLQQGACLARHCVAPSAACYSCCVVQSLPNALLGVGAEAVVGASARLHHHNTHQECACGRDGLVSGVLQERILPVRSPKGSPCD